MDQDLQSLETGKGHEHKVTQLKTYQVLVGDDSDIQAGQEGRVSVLPKGDGLGDKFTLAIINSKAPLVFTAPGPSICVEAGTIGRLVYLITQI
jgi:hypothetical protein